MSVPSELQTELFEAFARHRADLDLCRYALAFRVIRHYLGAEWAHDRVKLSDNHDSFMLNEFDEKSENRRLHEDRVVNLANALFQLRGAQNAGALHERFRTRDTRSCFLEATAASYFAKNNFHIEIVRESGSRGNDFDFTARKAGLALSVEVTGATSQTLAYKSLKNLLNYKRGQVPPDRPAVLFISIPETWTRNGDISEATIGTAIRAFFRGSKRFNVVVFLWDVVFPISDARLFAIAQRPYFHPAPRHPTVGLRWLRKIHAAGDLVRLQETVASGDVNKLEDFAVEKDPGSVLGWTMHNATPLESGPRSG